MKMKGYKAFNADLTCRDFQYEVGRIYETDEQISLCEQGFHFCRNLSDVYNYYPLSDDTRICEVVALGKIETDGVKYVTNKIKISREIKSKAIKHANVNKTEVGYCNSGNRNSGIYNSGNRNCGAYNSGDRNYGAYNSGCKNAGNWNSGNRNSGYSNTGYNNTGNSNSGNKNTGNGNTGLLNSGCFNSGNVNSGDWNAGNWNSGDNNSGDWNAGNYTSGVFNTDKNPKIKMFDKDSDWTILDWRASRAYEILRDCPQTSSVFVYGCDMTDEEKENHPEYKTTGGYIKMIVVTKEDKKKWYDELPEEYKAILRHLPNYDEEKFFKCIGII